MVLFPCLILFLSAIKVPLASRDVKIKKTGFKCLPDRASNSIICEVFLFASSTLHFFWGGGNFYLNFKSFNTPRDTLDTLIKSKFCSPWNNLTFHILTYLAPPPPPKIKPRNVFFYRSWEIKKCYPQNIGKTEILLKS